VPYLNFLANNPPSGTYVYQVKEGDNLWLISGTYTTNKSEKLIYIQKFKDLNPGINPLKMHVGDKILLPEKVDPSDYLKFNGTVKFVTLEGGFWGIVADDGKQYDPANLAPEFKQDGLQVQVEAVIKHDVASIHMWGTIIEIIKMSRIKRK